MIAIVTTKILSTRMKTIIGKQQTTEQRTRIIIRRKVITKTVIRIIKKNKENLVVLERVFLNKTRFPILVTSEKALLDILGKVFLDILGDVKLGMVISDIGKKLIQ